MSYTGGVPVNAGFYPRSSFPIAEAKDIYVSDEQRLDVTIAELQRNSFSGDYQDLKNKANITEDNSKNVTIADGSGNVVFVVDKDGVHTTALTLNGDDVQTSINEVNTKVAALNNVAGTYILTIDYEKLLAFDTAEIVIADNSGSGGTDDENAGTSAVLGVAVLGQMVLG